MSYINTYRSLTWYIRKPIVFRCGVKRVLFTNKLSEYWCQISCGIYQHVLLHSFLPLPLPTSPSPSLNHTCLPSFMHPSIQVRELHKHACTIVMYERKLLGDMTNSGSTVLWGTICASLGCGCKYMYTYAEIVVGLLGYIIIGNLWHAHKTWSLEHRASCVPNKNVKLMCVHVYISIEKYSHTCRCIATCNKYVYVYTFIHTF